MLTGLIRRCRPFRIAIASDKMSFLSPMTMTNASISAYHPLLFEAHQNAIPPFPVPDLDLDVLPKYLDSLIPIFIQALPKEELENAIKLALEAKDDSIAVSKILENHPIVRQKLTLCRSNFEAFSRHIGKRLRDHLISLSPKDRTLFYEKVWLEKAYHGFREPLVPHSNWWMLLKAPPLFNINILPTIDSLVTSKDYRKITELMPDPQICRTASIIYHALDFQKLIYSESIPTDHLGNGAPLCMNQYSNLYGICRIPKPKVDVVQRTWPLSHISLLIPDGNRNIRLYKMTLPSQNASKEQDLSMETIISNLLTIRKLMRDPSVVAKRALPIGLYTSFHRDDWADLYQSLQRSSAEDSFTAKLQDAITTLQTSAFILSIECENPTTEQQTIRSLFLSNNGCRWLDSALNFIIFPNGHAGLVGEHSPSDAIVPSKLVDHIIEKEKTSRPFTLQSRVAPIFNIDIIDEKTVTCPNPVQEFRKMDPYLKALIKTPGFHTLYQNRFETWLSYLRCTILSHEEYGTRRLKQLGLSPDAFLQSCIFLTFARLHEGRLPVTYETASTKAFLHGRTETIRSLTKEAIDYISCWRRISSTGNNVEWLTEADVRAGRQTEKIWAALKRFVQRHNENSKDASTGKGIDRLFSYLRYLHQTRESSLSGPHKASDRIALFEDENDPGFWPSQTHEGSTSNMSPGSSFIGLGFGTLVPHGYGINYAITSNRFLFSISAWQPMPPPDHSSKTATYYPMLDCPRLKVNEATGTIEVCKSPQNSLTGLEESLDKGSRAVRFRTELILTLKIMNELFLIFEERVQTRRVATL